MTLRERIEQNMREIARFDETHSKDRSSYFYGQLTALSRVLYWMDEEEEKERRKDEEKDAPP